MWVGQDAQDGMTIAGEDRRKGSQLVSAMPATIVSKVRIRSNSIEGRSGSNDQSCAAVEVSEQGQRVTTMSLPRIQPYDTNDPLIYFLHNPPYLVCSCFTLPHHFRSFKNGIVRSTHCFLQLYNSRFLKFISTEAYTMGLVTTPGCLIMDIS